MQVDPTSNVSPSNTIAPVVQNNNPVPPPPTTPQNQALYKLAKTSDSISEFYKNNPLFYVLNPAQAIIETLNSKSAVEQLNAINSIKQPQQ